MDPVIRQRYVARYRRLEGGTITTSKVMLGRFFDEAAARAFAVKRYGYPGTEIIEVRPMTAWEDRAHSLWRIFIRSTRIAIGLVAGLAVVLVFFSGGSGIGDTPFSQLTLNALVGAIFKAGFAIALVCLCWYIAFGPAPQEDSA
jgi:hypothetical protein